MPIPFGQAFEAFSGAKLVSAFWMSPFLIHRHSICATFSSSVMRRSRSSTRASTGAFACL